MPDIHKLLEDFKNNFQIGLATNSRLREVEKIIFDKLELHTYFDIKLARNHVKNVKPHPEIYLKDACILKVDPSEFIFFEYSIVGINVAKSAGNVLQLSIIIRKKT